MQVVPCIGAQQFRESVFEYSIKVFSISGHQTGKLVSVILPFE